jgi:hypothetical protein
MSPRTVIDVAVGVIIGWRSCTQREAFDELAKAVSTTGVGIGTTGVGIGTLATALIDTASNAEFVQHRDAVMAIWGDVIPEQTKPAASGPQHVSASQLDHDTPVA